MGGGELRKRRQLKALGRKAAAANHRCPLTCLANDRAKPFSDQIECAHFHHGLADGLVFVLPNMFQLLPVLMRKKAKDTYLQLTVGDLLFVSVPQARLCWGMRDNAEPPCKV